MFEYRDRADGAFLSAPRVEGLRGTSWRRACFSARPPMTACRRDTRQAVSTQIDREFPRCSFLSLGGLLKASFRPRQSTANSTAQFPLARNPIVKKKKKRGQLSRCGKDENSTNQGSACGPRWIGALHFSRHVPLTSAPRHTRFDPRDLPRPRTHTREMTGKNCENCNGAPAAWFCNSDGKPARGARASLFIFRGTRHFRSKTFPLWARTDR
jgi:hypothetical protein